MSTKSTIRGAALAVMLLAVLAGCGHKGILLAPLANIPKPPSDIKVIQRGSRVIIEWKNPTAYVDGHHLEGIAAVNIWMVEEEVEADKPAMKPLSAEDRQARAALLAVKLWLAEGEIEIDEGDVVLGVLGHGTGDVDGDAGAADSPL